MSSTHGLALHAPISLALDDEAPITMKPMRAHAEAMLGLGPHVAVELKLPHLRALRDQLPEVLAMAERAAADHAALAAGQVAAARAAAASNDAYRAGKEAMAAGLSPAGEHAIITSSWARTAAAAADAMVVALMEATETADNAADAAETAAAAADQAREAARE